MGDEQPKTFLKFKAGQQSPTLEIANGEYRRQFDAKEQPFEVEPREEAPMLLRTGHFEEVKEPQTVTGKEPSAEKEESSTTADAEVVASKTESQAVEGARALRKKAAGKASDTPST